MTAQRAPASPTSFRTMTPNALSMVRELLSFMPSNNLDDASEEFAAIPYRTDAPMPS